ncbi:MAG TPA: hypothetical protein VGN72_19685 [Tepidisphaeraceae bacterium]|jgi:hypothetical protein|nr:hypothetical protein [Tepidisphaeraceae bacterium]
MRLISFDVDSTAAIAAFEQCILEELLVRNQMRRLEQFKQMPLELAAPPRVVYEPPRVEPIRGKFRRSVTMADQLAAIWRALK